MRAGCHRVSDILISDPVCVGLGDLRGFLIFGLGILLFPGFTLHGYGCRAISGFVLRVALTMMLLRVCVLLYVVFVVLGVCGLL